jgi:hypothetical protein
LIADYYKYSNGNSYNKEVTFRATWSYVRKEPIGEEIARGMKEIQMSLTDFEPFIIIIEKNSQDLENGATIDDATIPLDEMLPKLLNLGATTETQIIKLKSSSEG